MNIRSAVQLNLSSTTRTDMISEELQNLAKQAGLETGLMAVPEGFTPLVYSRGVAGVTVSDLKKFAQAVAATQRHAIPAGYWLAPMEMDAVHIEAGYDAVFRRAVGISSATCAWSAMRDSYLARHPEHAAGEAVPRQALSVEAILKLADEADLARDCNNDGDVQSTRREDADITEDIVAFTRAIERACCAAPEADALTGEAVHAPPAETEREELERLRALVNSPETKSFLIGVHNEVAHQIERWGTVHDRAKEPADWFWLLGYLGGKALRAHADGDTEKALHHCISSAAVLANWHLHIKLGAGLMQPGSSDLQDFFHEVFGANFIEYQECDK